jgi:outer membrane protein assembly factor BamA
VGGLSWVWTILGRVRVVASGRIGAIQPLPDTDVIPLQERFFLGGESTIRSFGQDEAGPTQNGDPIGGEAFVIFNLELRVPLLVLDDLHGAVFFDTGCLTEEVEDIGGGQWDFGIGPGIRYNTPVGPVRLDVGFNPDRGPEDDLFAVHFSIGYPF